MPLISVITPTNSIKWLTQAYKSLARQTLTDWEWVVVANGDACNLKAANQAVQQDPRVKVVVFTGKKNSEGTFNVGALKKQACDHVTSAYAVEFDHDDELSVDCLHEVYSAFLETDADFIYSDAVRVHGNGQPEIYGSAYGWEYEPRDFVGDAVENNLVAKHPPAYPQNITRIWYAPDHVRAWNMESYRAVGGHNPELKVCDDLELICKLYRHREGRIHHIPKVLYRYLIHGENTWLKNIKLIEELTYSIHDRNIIDFARMYWSKRGYQCIDIGGGINPPAGWVGVDKHSAPIIADLDERWPFEDSSVGAIRAQDILEHLKNPVHVMNEAYRVLEHGGLFLIEVPSTDGRGAFQDPSHISFWNSNSFWYYTKAQTQHYIKHLGVNCRFQMVRIANYFPTDWHKLHNIVYTKAHLAAIKDGPRLHGQYEI